jgi:hypothetical protein
VWKSRLWRRSWDCTNLAPYWLKFIRERERKGGEGRGRDSRECWTAKGSIHACLRGAGYGVVAGRLMPDRLVPGEIGMIQGF